MTTNIYILTDPLTQQVRYVGKANDHIRRLKDHLRDPRSQGEYKKMLWVQSLKNNKTPPEITVVDEVEMDNWKYWEKWWISYFKSIGCDLLNVKDGGNGLSVADDNSFRTGRKPWNYGKKIKK